MKNYWIPEVIIIDTKEELFEHFGQPYDFYWNYYLI